MLILNIFDNLHHNSNFNSKESLKEQQEVSGDSEYDLNEFRMEEQFNESEQENKDSEEIIKHCAKIDVESV